MMRLLTLCFVTATAAMTALPQNPPTKNPPSTNPPSNPQNPNTPSRPGSETRDWRLDGKEDDNFLASWILIANNNEVALAQLAQQRATDPEVKQYAQKLIEDHGQFAQKLQSFAPGVGVTGNRGDSGKDYKSTGGTDRSGDKGGTDGAQQPTIPSDRRDTDVAREGSYAHGDKVALLQELGDQCLQSSRRELEQKQGTEFDRCFIGMAIGQHMGVNDMLTVFQRHVSTQLKPVLSDGQNVVSMHLQKAKDIAKRLEGKSSASSRDINGK